MKPKAIVCDDEEHIRTIMKVVLRGMNVEVVAEASSADQALDLFRREKPHLLLLDINMPGKTGEEALSEIMAELPSALVIMLTSVSDMDTVKRCLEKGAANYILKDTPVPYIKQIIKETWEEHRKVTEGSGNA